MDTIISLRPEELTEDFYKQLQSMASAASTIEIKISGMTIANGKVYHQKSLEEFPLKETKKEYFARLDQSIKNVEEGKVTSFTWDEFNDYTKQLLNEP